MHGRQLLAKPRATSDHGPILTRTTPRIPKEAIVPFECVSMEETSASGFIDAGHRTMDRTEGRQRGFLAEVRRFFDCINEVDAATGAFSSCSLCWTPAKALAASSLRWAQLERWS
jgi:hypothetical protein